MPLVEGVTTLEISDGAASLERGGLDVPAVDGDAGAAGQGFGGFDVDDAGFTGEEVEIVLAVKCR